MKQVRMKLRDFVAVYDALARVHLVEIPELLFMDSAGSA